MFVKLIIMRRAVRAILVKDNRLLVMHRNKFGHEYDTLPGGNVEIGETSEEALARELHDETQFVLKRFKLVLIEHCEHPYGDQQIYLVEADGEEPKIRPGAEEELINKLGKNLYEPRWLPLSELDAAPFVTRELKEHITKALAGDWPEAPVEFHSKRG